MPRPSTFQLAIDAIDAFKIKALDDFFVLIDLPQVDKLATLIQKTKYKIANLRSKAMQDVRLAPQCMNSRVYSSH
jgi:hypothetical protein